MSGNPWRYGVLMVLIGCFWGLLFYGMSLGGAVGVTSGMTFGLSCACGTYAERRVS